MALVRAGYRVRGLDLRATGPEQGDVRDRAAVQRMLHGCVGVVHLAAVSRVIDGERDPDRCWSTNVDGTRVVLDAAREGGRPWVVYASSREVYGQPAALPVTEDAPLVPVNVYGRCKAAAERLTRASELLTSVVRFSNVYGSTEDHPDRVVPAFARQAALGLPLSVEGSDHTFDFTHLDDTIRGLMEVVQRLEAATELPPMHFPSGTPTTLGGLARLAVGLAGSASPICEAPPRSYDVSSFWGDPSRAYEMLGWRAKVTLREGLSRLIAAYRSQPRTPEVA
jgi:nucleoside-diphosphate-sugar epimerase